MYSRVTLTKAHVFDHETGSTLCGTREGLWYGKPNKRLLDAKEMLKRHRQIAIDRGYPNPYKWSCKKCEEKLKGIVEGNH